MHPVLTAQHMVDRNGECMALGVASAARLLAYGLSISPRIMTALRRNVLEQPTDRRVTPRLSVRRARSWTGRSVVAFATDSHLSRLATAGTRVTRVSAMRIPPVRAERFVFREATLATGHATPLRRMDPGPLITSG